MKNKEPLLLGEELVLIDLATTAFGGIAGTLLPLIGNDHL